MRLPALFLAIAVLAAVVLALPHASEVVLSQASTTSSSAPANTTQAYNTSKPGSAGTTSSTGPYSTTSSAAAAQTNATAPANTTRATQATSPTQTSTTTSRATGTGPSARATNDSSDAGDFAVKDRSVAGVHVSFGIDLSRCALDHLFVQGKEVFETIELGGKGCAVTDETGDDVGARFRLSSSQGTVLVFDHPSGLVRFNATGLRVVVGPGTAFPRERSGTIGAPGDASGGATTTALVSFDNGEKADVHGNGLLANGAGSLSVRSAHVFDKPGSVAAVEAGLLAQRRLGGRVDVQLGPHGDARPAALPFDDVDIKADAPARDHVRIHVTASLAEGRTFLTSFPPGTFPDDRIEVRYFLVDAQGREVRGTIQRLDSVDAVLASPIPAYTVVREGDVVTLVFNVSHWSTHVFEVLHIPAQAAPIVLYGVVFLALFASTGALGLALGWRARRRRAAQRRQKRSPRESDA